MAEVILPCLVLPHIWNEYLSSSVQDFYCLDIPRQKQAVLSSESGWTLKVLA